MTDQVRFDRNGRRQYQSIDRIVRSTLKRRGDECGICGQAIDYELPQYHPGSFEVDHVIPISHGGTKEIGNSRSSHRQCNRFRSNAIDDDAIAAGAVPPDEVLSPPPELCQRCAEVHRYPRGVTFKTCRTW